MKELVQCYSPFKTRGGKMESLAAPFLSGPKGRKRRKRNPSLSLSLFGPAPVSWLNGAAAACRQALPKTHSCPFARPFGGLSPTSLSLSSLRGCDPDPQSRPGSQLPCLHEKHRLPPFVQGPKTTHGANNAPDPATYNSSSSSPHPCLQVQGGERR